MFDLTDGGDNNHSNGYTYTDLAWMDDMDYMTIGINLYYDASGEPYSTSGLSKAIVEKADAPSSIRGFLLGTNTAGPGEKKIRFVVSDGAGVNNSIALTNDLPDNTLVSLVYQYSHTGTDTWMRVSASGIEDKTVSSGYTNLTIGNNSRNMTIGLSSSGTNGGWMCWVGQVMIWRKALNTEEIENYHSGIFVPAPNDLIFWDKCVDNVGDATRTGAELMFNIDATESGVVTLGNNTTADTKFSGSGVIPAYKFVPSRSLRIFQFAPEMYRIQVPLEALKYDLGDTFGLAHSSIPRADTLINNLSTTYMLEPYKRMLNSIVSSKIDMDKHSMELTCLNMEPIILQASSSAAVDEPVNSSGEGITKLDTGGDTTNTRSSRHYILDPSALTTGATQLAEVAPFSLKTNHIGTYYEPAFDNLCKNSAFLEDGAGPPAFLDTTQSTGTGGTITAVDDTTVNRLFRNETIDGYDVQTAAITYGSAGDCYIQWSCAIDTSGENLRVAIWHRGDAGGVQIQRTSDSSYRNAANTNWSGTSTSWISLPAATDWTRTVLERITSVPTSGTITLRVGIQAALGTGTLYLGQVQAYQHRAIFTDLVNTGSITTPAVADSEVTDLDNAGADSRQTFYPPRGTFRARLIFTTDTANMPNSTTFTIAKWGIDSNNYDLLSIDVSGGTRYLSLARYISGALDAEATLTVSIPDLDDEMEIAGRWISNDGDLGLSNYTMSVFVDGTKGTDDQASATHSSSDQTTFLRIGTSDGSEEPATYFAIKDWELVQRAIPDEEILGRRLGTI